MNRDTKAGKPCSAAFCTSRKDGKCWRQSDEFLSEGDCWIILHQSLRRALADKKRLEGLIVARYGVHSMTRTTTSNEANYNLSDEAARIAKRKAGK
jgi:hypothetical protein